MLGEVSIVEPRKFAVSETDDDGRIRPNRDGIKADPCIASGRSDSTEEAHEALSNSRRICSFALNKRDMTVPAGMPTFLAASS